MTDPLDDPGYQEWLADLAMDCRARDKPCGGCQAGGICDGAGGGILSEDCDGGEDGRDFDYDGEWE